MTGPPWSEGWTRRGPAEGHCRHNAVLCRRGQPLHRHGREDTDRGTLHAPLMPSSPRPCRQPSICGERGGDCASLRTRREDSEKGLIGTVWNCVGRKEEAGPAVRKEAREGRKGKEGWEWFLASSHGPCTGQVFSEQDCTCMSALFDEQRQASVPLSIYSWRACAWPFDAQRVGYAACQAGWACTVRRANLNRENRNKHVGIE